MPSTISNSPFGRSTGVTPKSPFRKKEKIIIFKNVKTDLNILVPPSNYYKTRGASQGLEDEEIMRTPDTLVNSKRREWLRRNFLIHVSVCDDIRGGYRIPKTTLKRLSNILRQLMSTSKVTLPSMVRNLFETFFLDFVEACRKEPALKSISTSLFHYFDKKGCGAITFIDMCRALIPGLDSD